MVLVHIVNVVVDYCAVNELDEEDNTVSGSVTITDPLEGVTFNVYHSLDDGKRFTAFIRLKPM